jgi:hypothetical protein
MFLTPDELKTLTSYELSAWQRRWLDRHQWRYESAANGRVVVSRAYAESRLNGTKASNAPVMNLDWMKKRA